MKCKFCGVEIKAGELIILKFTAEQKNRIKKFNKGMCPACKKDLFFAGISTVAL
jgi:hypothetical protein